MLLSEEYFRTVFFDDKLKITSLFDLPQIGGEMLQFRRSPDDLHKRFAKMLN